jgi:nitrogen fixation NifU-like protein
MEEEMSQENELVQLDTRNVREMLSGSGYSERAIAYYLNKPNMGCLSDADQVTELTGECGDTMKVYLKLEGDRIKDAKYQVLGCPGAVAAAMAVVDLVKGRTLQESASVNDHDIFCRLKGIPDQKVHCIRLAVKTLQKAIADYRQKNGQDQ